MYSIFFQCLLHLAAFYADPHCTMQIRILQNDADPQHWVPLINSWSSSHQMYAMHWRQTQPLLRSNRAGVRWLS